MDNSKKKLAEILPLSLSDGLPGSLEELETRLESQMAVMPMALDDAYCLYYLCTTRCSGMKCPVYCACDVVVDLGGVTDVS